MKRIILAAAALLPLALFAPSPASAAANHPTLADQTSCHGNNGCDLTIPSQDAGLHMMILVAADGPFEAAEHVTVTVNEATVPAATSISYVNGISGYTGIFTVSSVGSGGQTYQVRGDNSGLNIYAQALVFNNSSGFAGAASASTQSANPSVSITAGDSNAWVWCVVHDWDREVTPSTGASGFDVYGWWDDPNGDTGVTYDGSAYTTSSTQVQACGAGTSSPSMSGDEDNISGIAVLGS